jgi:hypothetical protein
MAYDTRAVLDRRREDRARGFVVPLPVGQLVPLPDRPRPARHQPFHALTYHNSQTLL